MISLDIYVASHFAQRRKYFQSVWMHFDEARSKREVCIHLLIAIKRLIQNLQRSFDNGAVAEGVNVTRMNYTYTRTCFWAWTIAGHTLAIFSCFVAWTCSHTSAVVFQQMFWTVSYASCSISVFAIGIWFPQVICRIVLLHRWAFLLADTVVVEITTCQTVLLCWSRTTTSTE